MPMIEVSNGEIVDRYTILALKIRKINDDAALANIRVELDMIMPLYDEIVATPTLKGLAAQLASTNESLWKTEDRLRLFESEKEFGHAFVQLARSVYELNDKRSQLKKKINTITNSHIVEEKSYEKY